MRQYVAHAKSITSTNYVDGERQGLPNGGPCLKILS